MVACNLKKLDLNFPWLASASGLCFFFFESFSKQRPNLRQNILFNQWSKKKSHNHLFEKLESLGSGICLNLALSQASENFLLYSVYRSLAATVPEDSICAGHLLEPRVSGLNRSFPYV